MANDKNSFMGMDWMVKDDKPNNPAGYVASNPNYYYGTLEGLADMQRSGLIGGAALQKAQDPFRITKQIQGIGDMGVGSDILTPKGSELYRAFYNTFLGEQMRSKQIAQVFGKEQTLLGGNSTGASNTKNSSILG